MTARRSLIALGVLAVLLSAGTAQALEGGEKAPEFSLPQYDALELNEQSPIFRYSKRAYFIIDLLKPEDVLQAFKDSGAK
jgi:hypothetical protein